MDIGKAEWIRRCTNRYVDQGGATGDEAREWAEDLFNDLAADGTRPEEAADTDMSYWVDG